VLDQRLFHGLERELRQLGQRVEGLGRGLPDPQALLGQASQRFDDLAERLPHALTGRIERAGRELMACGARLAPPARALLRQRAAALDGLGLRLTLDELRARIPRHARGLAELAARQDHATMRRIDDAAAKLSACASLLNSLSYRGVLQRGFALVRDEQDALVRDAESARRAGSLELEFKDGRVRTMAVARPARRVAGGGDAGGQGRLL
jgi:exodeoxyribonuclease VII large subunit